MHKNRLITWFGMVAILLLAPGKISLADNAITNFNKNSTHHNNTTNSELVTNLEKLYQTIDNEEHMFNGMVFLYDGEMSRRYNFELAGMGIKYRDVYLFAETGQIYRLLLYPLEIPRTGHGKNDTMQKIAVTNKGKPYGIVPPWPVNEYIHILEKQQTDNLAEEANELKSLMESGSTANIAGNEEMMMDLQKIIKKISQRTISENFSEIKFLFRNELAALNNQNILGRWMEVKKLQVNATLTEHIRLPLGEHFGFESLAPDYTIYTKNTKSVNFVLSQPSLNIRIVVVNNDKGNYIVTRSLLPKKFNIKANKKDYPKSLPFSSLPCLYDRDRILIICSETGIRFFLAKDIVLNSYLLGSRYPPATLHVGVTFYHQESDRLLNLFKMHSLPEPNLVSLESFEFAKYQYEDSPVTPVVILHPIMSVAHSTEFCVEFFRFLIDEPEAVKRYANRKYLSDIISFKATFLSETWFNSKRHTHVYRERVVVIRNIKFLAIDLFEINILDMMTGRGFKFLARPYVEAEEEETTHYTYQ